MGMAASQARFLGLTARKNNVEFEGQQINQQRTTLSNQSANYYNDLLGMSVPTAPSVDDYTETVYTFEDGALTNTITALIAQGNGTYTISYLSSYEDDYSIVSAASSVVTNTDSGYMIGSTVLRVLGGLSSLLTEETDDDGNVTYSYSGTDAYLSTLSSDELAGLKLEEEYYLALLEDKYGTSNWMVRYVQDSSTGAYVPYFYQTDDLDEAFKNGNGETISSIKCYTIGSATTTSEVKGVTGVQVERDTTGRYISISIPETYTDSNGEKQTTYITYSLTTSTVTDQDAYDDAMNQYEYDKYLYDQTIQEINAKIEIIQAEDKNLELRLKQLDTEQNAISTELDAVEKVIEKNTESSFKTFG